MPVATYVVVLPPLLTLPLILRRLMDATAGNWLPLIFAFPLIVTMGMISLKVHDSDLLAQIMRTGKTTELQTQTKQLRSKQKLGKRRAPLEAIVSTAVVFLRGASIY